MMGGTYQKPIYSRQQELYDKIKELLDDGDPFTPTMDPTIFEEGFLDRQSFAGSP